MLEMLDHNDIHIYMSSMEFKKINQHNIKAWTTLKLETIIS